MIVNHTGVQHQLQLGHWFIIFMFETHTHLLDIVYILVSSFILAHFFQNVIIINASGLVWLRSLQHRLNELLIKPLNNERYVSFVDLVFVFELFVRRLLLIISPTLSTSISVFL